MVRQHIISFNEFWIEFGNVTENVEIAWNKPSGNG